MAKEPLSHPLIFSATRAKTGTRRDLICFPLCPAINIIPTDIMVFDQEKLTRLLSGITAPPRDNFLITDSQIVFPPNDDYGVSSLYIIPENAPAGTILAKPLQLVHYLSIAALDNINDTAGGFSLNDRWRFATELLQKFFTSGSSFIGKLENHIKKIKKEFNSTNNHTLIFAIHHTSERGLGTSLFKSIFHSIAHAIKFDPRKTFILDKTADHISLQALHSENLPEIFPDALDLGDGVKVFALEPLQSPPTRKAGALPGLGGSPLKEAKKYRH